MNNLFVLGVCQTPVCCTWSELSPYLQQAAANGPGLFALPELVVGGFDVSNREQWAGQSAQLQEHMHGLCRNSDAMFIGSFWEKRGSDFYNTLNLISRSGITRLGDKIHLFPLVHEADFITAGQNTMQPLNAGPLTLGGAICFDLRFPEVFRSQLGQAEVDVFAVCAQWPLQRLEHLQALLKARAIENQAYILFANACRNAPGMEPLAGHSALISPSGEILFEMNQTPGLEQAAFDPELLKTARQSFDSRHACLKTVFGQAAG